MNMPTLQQKKKRKIVQIAAVRVDLVDNALRVYDNETQLVALCDDSTVWTLLGPASGREWVEAPAIPQDV